ncbi:LacI family transcriptional regulator [Acidovorax sp. Leaf76]|uniref:tripartite tricarboxylate transporter substrate binding protein n=1 Tax=unclassified Acidovorax TaxID=2684926 RepID=UPI0006F9B188|nr:MULTISPECIES: tripartite tricarboxylate transporter substrate binding protein [unclassified Acidovorax]KQO25611.1 LacI family transcriptional regulator [Acidovorax sp. Leaf76]KQO29294.1 LacI family transcriptional regulator [Acidovorax sp. Leaf84]KQS25817.1 LacI family transcriptional regulator [Acidovorax sp. Leaf191]
MNRGMANRRALLAGAACALVAPWVSAQAFPSKPLRLIVPFPAGGGTDAMARALGDALSRDLGQSVIVDNRSGAGTVIGNDALAKSAPDGHSLLLNTSAIAIVPSLHPKLPYPADTAFAPVMLLGRAPNVAVVRMDSPMKSAADFIAQARAHPGKMAYGSAGNGTSTHLAAELLKSTAKLFVTHVPYRGAAPVINDVVAGQIDLAFGTLPSVAPMLTSGKLRALAVTSAKRSPLLPDVPTFAESGVTGYEADAWYGVFVPGATPAGIVDQLYAAVQRAAQTDSFQRRAAAEGLVLTMDRPQETARIVRAEESKWRRVIQAQSIKIE